MFRYKLSVSHHETSDCPVTVWLGASGSMLKNRATGRLQARRGSDVPLFVLFPMLCAGTILVPYGS